MMVEYKCFGTGYKEVDKVENIQATGWVFIEKCLMAMSNEPLHEQYQGR